jgi:bacteriorhodopsin
MNDPSPYIPPRASVEQLTAVESSRRTPWIIIAVIALIAFLNGIGEGLFKGTSYYNLYYFSTLAVFVVLAVAWYRSDAKLRGLDPSTGMSVAIVIIAIIAVPVYLFRSRGAGKGALATVLFLLYVFGCGLLSALGLLLVLGPAGL